MLNLWRRHTRRCLKRLQSEGVRAFRSHKKCSCPIWVQGSLHGEWMKKSLEVRNWESAQKLVRDWEAGAKERTVPLRRACEKFEKDAGARGLGDTQLAKYRLLTKELKAFFPDRVVASISVEDLRAYRETWELAPVTAYKKLERLRTFFKFCQEAGWISNNVAKLLTPPKVKMRPTLPFSDKEWEKIEWALDLYRDQPKGRRRVVRAFVLLLRYSGLRIGDAISLETKNIRDGKLLLRTGKTGQPVWLPLREEVISALEPLGAMPFWSGIGKLKSAVADWQRSLKKLFTLAAVKGHAHMFRDTFAVDLLKNGVSLENVAALLGNSVRIAEKHYAPWVKARQEELEKAVKKVWAENRVNL